MKKIFFTFFIELVLFIRISNLSKSNEIELIKDFTVRSKVPTVVTAIVNWRNDEVADLSKMLSSINIQHVIHNYNHSLKMTENLHFNIFVVDLDIYELKENALQSNKSLLFGVYYEWLILNVNSEKLKVLSLFDIFVGSKVYIAETCDKNLDSSYNISSIYRKHENSTHFLRNDIAYWSYKKHFHYYNELMITRNRSNLMGTVIKLGSVIIHKDTLEHMWDFRNTHLDVLSKSSYMLVHTMIEMMNGTVAYRTHYAWEYHGNDSEFQPMVEDLFTGRADISGSTIGLLENRRYFVEYASLTTKARVVFLLKEPPLSTVQNLYTLTFENDVWIACLFLIGVSFLPLLVVFQLECKKTFLGKPNNLMSHVKKPNFSDLALVQVEVVCQQGTDSVPKSISGRIILLNLLIAFMFLYNSFSANIVALLQTTSDSIRTLDDLLNTKIKLGVENLSYNKLFFTNENESLRKKIYETKIKYETDSFIPMERGIQKVKTEFYAFHCELIGAQEIISKTFTEHEKCGLKAIQFFAIPPYSVFRKNSTYRDIFRMNFRRITELGIQSRLARKMFTTLPVCDKSVGIFITVGLSDCYFVFSLFGIGIGISLVLLIFEISFKRFVRKQK